MYANKFSGLMAVLSCTLTLGASLAQAQDVPSMAQAGAPAASTVSPTTAPPLALRTSESANLIAEINERMSVMQAQLAQLELQAKIAAKNDEIRRFGKQPEGMDEGFTPAVMEISGVDGKLMANLMVQGGNIQTVRVGDKVGGWDIKSISIDSLTMARGKETKRLSFGSYVQSPPPAASQGPQVPGMVPGMPLPR